MKRKTPMTHEQHVELAAELQRLHRTATDLLLKTQHHVTKQQLRPLLRVLSGVSDMRCAMDTELARHHPQTFKPSVYYPNAAHLPW